MDTVVKEHRRFLQCYPPTPIKHTEGSRIVISLGDGVWCTPRLEFSLLWSGCWFNSLGDGALGLQVSWKPPSLGKKEGKTFS